MNSIKIKTSAGPSRASTSQQHSGTSRPARPFAALWLLLIAVLASFPAFSAAPVYQSQSTAIASSNVSSLTIAKPPGTAAGDLLLATISTDDDQIFTTPTGWTLVNAGNGGGDGPTLAIYYKIAGASDSGLDDYTFTWDGGEQAAGAILRYSGAHNVIPLVAAGNGNNSSPTAPTLTTTFTDARVVRIYAADDRDLALNPYPSGHTGRLNIASDTGGGDAVTLGVADTTQASAAATGTAAFSLSSTEQWRAATVAFGPIPVTIDKTTATPTVSAGGQASYSIVVNNIGTTAVTGVTITDTLPAGFSFDTTVSGACGTPPNNGATGTVTWGTCSIAAGGTLTLSYTVDVPAGAAIGVYTNTASADTTQTNPVTDSADVTIPGADMAVTKTVNSPLPTEGDTVVYTVTATNTGGVSAANVVVTDSLPTGVTWVSTVPSQGSCSAPSGVTCQLGTVAPSASATVTITATVNGGLSEAVLTNSAAVSADNDVNAGNNSGFANIYTCPPGHIPNLGSVTGNQFDPNLSNNGDHVCTELTLLGTVTHTVYEDTNGNAQQDPGEPGIPNVQVQVTDSVGNVTTQTTDSNGQWTLSVPEGNTTIDIVDATLPAGLTQTQGSDPTTVTVPGGGTASDIDGFQPPEGTVDHRVYEDTNGNGVQDAGELGIAGVDVVITDSAGNSVTVTTNANGDIPTQTVPAGNTVIDIVDGTLPAGWAQTQGTDPTTVTVPSGGNASDIDGFQPPPGAVTHTVYQDTNGNGQQDTGEPGIPGVQVQVTDSAGNTTTQTTDANGEWTLTVPVGDTTIDIVESTLPAGVIRTEGTDPTTVTVPSGGTASDIDGYYVPVATVGNYVWLDENGDGVQDAGEAGIPNVTVELYESDGTTLVGTTSTDANGGYLFTGVDPGVSYVVKVLPPAGLEQTYDEDGTGTANESATGVLAAGEEYLTADFGYNWVTPTDSTNPSDTTTGAIGDRIWNDANGDGVQDAGEAGLAGVQVTIYHDPDGNGVYDTPYTLATDANGTVIGTGTTTTDAAGNYIFDNLPADGYVIEVDEATLPAGVTWTQTGDPDATLDGATTSPIVLAPGDVFVNADFGYQPNQGSTIGDTLYLDTNANGQEDAGEPGIPGVTVALEDGNGNVIATTTTDENGQYLFPGLPAGDYTVVVTDTENVLGEVVQSGDPDGTIDGRSTTTVDGLNDDLTRDFGYKPYGHDLGDGLIGDTIFLDRNGNSTPEAGEGIEGVVVDLYDSTGSTLLASTITDENGTYTFGGLDPAGQYQVRVDTATLPAGVTNSVDPDGGIADQSQVDLSATGPIDIDQDFGYTASTPNTIGGTLWEDRNADGLLTEPGRFEGVTVVLRDDSGNIVATTVTDANGDYSFTGLPDGTYTVDVTDDTNLLEGYWHSVGPNAGDGVTDNNSQSDPYTVTVSGGETNTTGDFGYYIDGAALGNRVWADTNGNGIQDTGEPGLGGVAVTLTITYPNGAGTTTLVTTSAADGSYSFANLLLDEDFNGGGAGEPTYSISVATPTGFTPSTVGAGGNTKLDSNLHTGAPATTVQGATDVALLGDPNNEGEQASYDFGYGPDASQLDFGDLPTAADTGFANDYPTTSAANGARHVVTGVYLGSNAPDAELDGQPTATADGDDLNGTDDEDGVSFPNGLVAGQTVPVTVVSAGAGVLNAWIDFNQNGILEAGEQVFTDQPLVSGTNTLTVAVPVGAATGNTGARFRVTDLAGQGGDSPTGLALSGEVEDYLVGIVPAGAQLDFGDLIDPSYATLQGSFGAAHILDGTTVLGTLVDAETDGQPNGTATGDDTAGTADEDGVSFTSTLVPGSVATLAVTTASGGVLNAWIDFNGNGTLDAGEQIASNLSLPAGTTSLSYVVPANAVPGSTGARFRLTASAGQGGESPTGLATTGEVEDYWPLIQNAPALGIDFGDLPDSYSTLLASNGAHHLIDGTVYLGGAPDAEADGQPTANADGDNTNGTNDEDGVTFSTLVPGSVASVTVNSSLAGNVLNAWIDFNGDGDFADAGEQIFTDLVLAAGNNPLGFNVPLGATTGLTGARFRVTASGETGVGPTGLANSGEVEDYLVSVEAASGPLGAIGNRLWLDENGDGIQDAGEPGLAGVTVELLDGSGNAVLDGNGQPIVAVTDTDGGYLFTGLPAGAYEIRVDTATLPLDNNGNPVVQSPLARPGADFGNQTQTGGTKGNAYPVTLAAGEENLTADFGYNWRPSGDVTGNTGSGAIGDRLWADADGDGVQDPGEPGLAGVTLTLTGAGPDGIFGNGDDTTATTTTGPAGNYVFNDLPAGAYTVTVDPANFGPGGALENYTQTGDPDQFGVPATGGDNTTTNPVLLAPGDVYLNADFGYQPPAAENNSIGDTVWFDANGDGAYQPDGGDGNPATTLDNEYGIAGVTVKLLDGNDDVIATTVTDANGEYLFDGLPDGTYTVVVNDTDHVLGELAPTFDADGGDDNRSTTSVSGGVADLDQDFGYAPAGHMAGDGLIGDTVFLDRDGNGLPDAGEGLEGVTVELRDSTGTTVLASTVTDENGNYSFGALPLGTYQVVVDTATLPDGLTNTVDPDAPTGDSRSTVTLDGTNPVNLDQDFGYAPTGGANNPAGRIGDRIWEDTDADGLYEPGNGEPGIDGVTIDLYEDVNGDGFIDSGDRLIGSTVTAGGGAYSFDNLPTSVAGVDYLVKVTDEAGLLNGYWHSVGPAAGDGVTDDNSQVDPYAVTLTAAVPDNTTGDFGYYIDGAALGNRVWVDTDGNGIQDTGEPGLGGVAVTLTITYPNGAGTTTLVTTSAADGSYSFANLLLDEDFNGGGASEPTYSISVATPTGFTPSTVGAGGNTKLDSNLHTGAPATTVQGATDVALLGDPNNEGEQASYDFGFQPAACDITISGNVFYDYTQLFDNTVNGLGFIPSGINAVLVRVNADTTETVVDAAAVPPRGDPDVGQFSFANLCGGGTYYVMLANTGTFTVGNPPPASSSLPGGYISTGENIGAGPGSDGTVDGKSAQFGLSTVDVVEVNFGILRFIAVTID